MLGALHGLPLVLALGRSSCAHGRGVLRAIDVGVKNMAPRAACMAIVGGAAIAITGAESGRFVAHMFRCIGDNIKSAACGSLSCVVVHR